MDMTHSSFANPKPAKTRKQVKAKKDRSETAVKQLVRAIVSQRDGDCRFQNLGLGPCSGESEWAHVKKYRRANTRRQPPEQRHKTVGTLMACSRHHDLIDGRQSPRLYLDLGPEGCNGTLVASLGSIKRLVPVVIR